MSVNLKAGVVRILNSQNQTVGTGFVISNDGLIATCAHVVTDAGAGPGDTVHLIFLATGEKQEARVRPEFWRDTSAEDIAILCLEEPLPKEIEPLQLGNCSGIKGHKFETFGFPPAKLIDGMGGDGTIGSSTKENGCPVLQLTSSQVSKGFSGAPVMNLNTRRVVGMVTSVAPPDQLARQTDTAFFTPTESLQAVCPTLQFSDICPYRSLDTFTEDDTEFFFGREGIIDQLLEQLQREPRFLYVLGPSGSGKSSLVQAGLVSKLRKGKLLGSKCWEVLITRPADNPFKQLAGQGLVGTLEDLSSAIKQWLVAHPEKTKLVLVIDQFEELLVTCPEQLRQNFLSQLKKLLEADLSITIVLVMRDDFQSRFTQQAPDLLEWLERGRFYVPLTLEKNELKEIVEKPAEAVGLKFETHLVDTIVSDVIEI